MKASDSMQAPDFVFFDYETLSSNPRNAAVISFGAVAGCWDMIRCNDMAATLEYLEKNSLYQTISAKQQVEELGLEASAETVRWWSEQGEEAKAMLESKNKISVFDHCKGFYEWCVSMGVTQKTMVYVRAPQFDHTILENVFSKCGAAVPYNTWKVRDVRSIIDFAYDVDNGYIPGFRESEYMNGMHKHYAVHDCWIDILQVKMCIDLKG